MGFVEDCEYLSMVQMEGFEYKILGVQ